MRVPASLALLLGSIGEVVRSLGRDEAPPVFPRLEPQVAPVRPSPLGRDDPRPGPSLRPPRRRALFRDAPPDAAPHDALKGSHQGFLNRESLTGRVGRLYFQLSSRGGQSRMS